MDISFLFNKYSEKIVDEKIFFSPNIPKKKLRNAINAYAKDVSKADTLLLYDNTCLGGAKAGMLISSQKIYISNPYEKQQSLELSKLKTVSDKFRVFGSRINFNGGDYYLTLDYYTDKKSPKKIFQMLEEMCGSKSASLDNINVTERAASVPKNCRSCGATNPPNFGACEYCETSLI